MPTSNRSSSINKPPSALTSSCWEPPLPAPRHPIRFTRAAYLLHLNQINLQQQDNHIYRPCAQEQGQGMNTSPTSNDHTRDPTSAADYLSKWCRTVEATRSIHCAETGCDDVQSGWQGDLLAQCSPSPATPYPCFDLNSGPHWQPDHHHRGLHSSEVSDVAGSGGLTSSAIFVVQAPVETQSLRKGSYYWSGGQSRVYWD